MFRGMWERIDWSVLVRDLGEQSDQLTACSWNESSSSGTAPVSADTTIATVLRRLLPPTSGDDVSAGARSFLASASSCQGLVSSKGLLSSSRMLAKALPIAALAAATPAATVLPVESKNCCGLGVRRRAPDMREPQPPPAASSSAGAIPWLWPSGRGGFSG